MTPSKLTASLSLDLDNQWSYMRTHADSGWERYPSYLPLLVPIVIDMLRHKGLKLTVFVVGRDATLPENRAALEALAEDGHEIGNHSHNHLQWLHKLSDGELEDEIGVSEEALEQVTGQRPRGFRGPGFALNERVLRVLRRRGYRYDCSTFPTFLGPLARAYYFMSARKLDKEEAEERKNLFGGVRDGLRPIRPFYWELGAEGRLLEIPVTTTPLLRTPLHLSYLLYLARFSTAAARLYLHGTLGACRAAGVEPSFLIHPLDFLSGESCPELRFFPAMDMPQKEKLRVTGRVLDYFCSYFDPVPIGEHARRIEARGQVPVRAPDFPEA